jgi:TBC1 domain-containing protein 4
LKTDLSYHELVKQTTIHQHAILLDLGRTFPNHTNFAKKYGYGQLALFNVLKAYSVLDSEVGYCQGLSFIVGILLIHVNNDECKAFELLKFLLIDLNFREQYKPDMMQLQKHMYQLTRLLNKYFPDIYSHFDCNEISPSLYAAPWFLSKNRFIFNI